MIGLFKSQVITSPERLEHPLLPLSIDNFLWIRATNIDHIDSILTEHHKVVARKQEPFDG